MPQPAQIPGFYFDAEKKKYFRILPSHAAPTSSFYSSSSIQQSQREKARDEEQKQEEAHRLKRKRRSAFKSNPYIRSTLYRELGGAGSNAHHAEDLRHVYAHGLRRHHAFEVEPGRKITAMAMDATEDEKKAMVIGTSAGDVRVLPIDETEHGIPRVDRSKICPLIASHSSVTSISISSQRCILATFLGGERQPPTIFFKSLSIPGSPGIQHTYNHIKSLWTSTSSPSCSTGVLLVGTSCSAIHLLPSAHMLHKTEYRIKSDVFATEFLPDSPHPFLCGSRDGDMRLFDIRVDNSGARPDIVVRHGSTITHIRALDNVNIVVNGLGRCAAYDLRFPHPASPSSNFARATRAGKVYENVARENESIIERGFDVDRERGVMVSADHEGWVNMYSVATGERLKSVLGERRWGVISKGLRFEGGDTGRLWAVEGGTLGYFSR